jgi:hypothetical protein
MSNSFHLAGIVPASSRPTGINLPWSDCLTPVAPNFFAIEYAVHQAAWAGCETIWVVCDYEATPLIRKRMGDFTYDPTSIGSKKFSLQPDKWRRLVPIYYVPIRPEEDYKSKCLPWSIIEGAQVANRICGKISRWTMPQSFFVSFPYGIYPTQAVRPHRQVISNPQMPNFYFTSQGRSVLTGNHLPFTFKQEDLETFIANFKTYENSIISGEMLEERKDHFTNDVDLAILYNRNEPIINNSLELEWFKQIDTWEGYKAYLGDPVSNTIKFPGRIFISYHEWNPIAEDLEDATEENENHDTEA